jgi:tagatose 1,6-diphosphate aldolase
MISSLSEAKASRLRALSTPTGVIGALAMDQRKSLRTMIAAEAAIDPHLIADTQLAEFKAAVTTVLSEHVSAILLDPDYGLEAAQLRHQGCGLLLGYESDGYENPRPHRMLALAPQLSVQRLRDLGAEAIKILLSYDPADQAANDEKQAWIERIGCECDSLHMPFLLEPVVYNSAGLDTKSFEFACRKPEMVVQTMAEFSKPVYRVDVLKVEFPVNLLFVDGSAVYTGKLAQSSEEARGWFAAADAAARVPYIYLSAGMSHEAFIASLEFAAGAGARFSGVLCGRANWQGGVAAYVRGGVDALSEWLAIEGVRNVKSVNERLKAATPWREWFVLPKGSRA